MPRSWPSATLRRTLLLATGVVALLSAPCAAFPSGDAHVDPRHHNHHHDEKHVPIWKRSAAEVVAQLNLTANPEKGYYIQTFQDSALVPGTNRSASTAIYYLLEGAAGQSVWHRLDAAEVWHYYAGAPLTLSRWNGTGTGSARDAVLGPDVFAGEAPQLVVGEWEWQSARSLGEWTLVGTTVAPGFVTTAYELAPDGWVPGA